MAPEGWAILNTNDIPKGSVQVDVTVDDNGTEHKCYLMAGHMSYGIPDETTVQPNLEWVLHLKVDKPPRNPYEEYD